MNKTYQVDSRCSVFYGHYFFGQLVKLTIGCIAVFELVILGSQSSGHTVEELLHAITQTVTS